MFERFTPEAIKVIMLAQEEARRSNHNYVDAQQLLLGMLGVKEGLAFKALKAEKVALQNARVELLKIVPRGTDHPAEEIPFTFCAKRVLELSWDEARLLREKSIGTEHLLLGTLREGRNHALEVLEGLGVDITGLRQKLLDLMGKTDSHDHEKKEKDNKDQDFQLPKGWVKAGSHPNEYDMGLDRQIKHTGTKSAFIKSNTDNLNGFGTLMQMFDASNFRGKRYRLTGWTRHSAVTGWASMWMRVDGPQTGRSLAFDNMEDRPLKGESDWAKQEIVLDVAEESTNVAFGVLLSGAGHVWMDDFKFEEVSKDIPTTGKKAGPINIDFEEEE